MYCTSIPLREHFPFLAQKNSGAVLDLFLPYNSVEMGREHQKRPCLLVCPGGGYAMVSEREGEPIALCFLPQGFNVFVLRYSVAPHRFPTQLLEVAAAMQLICQKAEEWNCDTDKIAIMGFSAGGHLAGHYSNRYNGPEVRQYFPQGVKPAASLLCYPVVTAGEYAHLGSFLNLLGHEPDEKEQADFSLEKMVTDDTPPAFLWHTAADDGVPVQNTLLYASALARHHVPFGVHIYPFGGHGLSTADAQTCGSGREDALVTPHTWLGLAAQWLAELFELPQ